MRAARAVVATAVVTLGIWMLGGLLGAALATLINTCMGWG